MNNAMALKTEVHAKGKMQGRKWKKQQSYVAAMICCFVWICCSTRRVGLSCCDLTCLGTGPGSILQTLVLKLSTSKIDHELKDQGNHLEKELCIIKRQAQAQEHEPFAPVKSYDVIL